jgi:hypothetical protein
VRTSGLSPPFSGEDYGKHARQQSFKFKDSLES